MLWLWQYWSRWGNNACIYKIEKDVHLKREGWWIIIISHQRGQKGVQAFGRNLVPRWISLSLSFLLWKYSLFPCWEGEQGWSYFGEVPHCLPSAPLVITWNCILYFVHVKKEVFVFLYFVHVEKEVDHSLHSKVWRSTSLPAQSSPCHNLGLYFVFCPC